MSATIVLASTSAYRAALLSRLGVDFVRAAPRVAETPVVGEPADARALRLAEEKACALAAQYPDALILGGDQTIAAGDDCFDKPMTAENAIIQLKKMRGRTLSFYTALAVLDTGSGACQSRLCTHRAQMRALDDDEIERYVAKEPALDCAGGAQIEGLGIALMADIQGGDPTALIGMSLIDAADLLRCHGVAVP